MKKEEKAEAPHIPSVAEVRLAAEMLWNGASMTGFNYDWHIRQAINAMDDEAERYIVAYLQFLMDRAERPYGCSRTQIWTYTPTVLGHDKQIDYEAVQSLLKKQVIDEHTITCATGSERDEMIAKLSDQEIRAIIADIDLFLKSENLGTKPATRDAMEDVLKDRITKIKCTDYQDRPLLSFITPRDIPSGKYVETADFFCMLYGGEFSAIPSPSADILNPERWEESSYRKSMVLDYLSSAPPLEWNAAPPVPITWHLYMWDEGYRMARKAYKFTWEAYGRLARRVKNVSQEHMKKKYSTISDWSEEKWITYHKREIKETIEALEREEMSDMSEEVQHHMGNRLNIHYWIMQALHALAQCAMHEEEFNLAIKMYSMIDEMEQCTVPSVRTEILYYRTLCHMEVKERKKAFAMLQKALTTSFSYTAPFEHVCEFMSFHLSHENQTFLRLGERLALERLMKELQAKCPWSEFKPVELIDVKAQKVSIGASNKRQHDSEKPLNAEDFVLSWYLDSLGPSWKGMACQGKIIAALCFLLTADIFQPEPKSKIATFLYPSRWREVPLDFGTPHFFKVRDYHIEKLLERIEEMSVDDVGSEVLRLHALHKEQRIGRLFREFAVEDLAVIAQTLMHANALLHLLQFFLLEGTLKGIPSVWLWSSGNNDAPSSVKCVTVKAIGESLSDNQRAWIHVLSAIGVHVEVCDADKELFGQKDANEQAVKRESPKVESAASTVFSGIASALVNSIEDNDLSMGDSDRSSAGSVSSDYF